MIVIMRVKNLVKTIMIVNLIHATLTLAWTIVTVIVNRIVATLTLAKTNVTVIVDGIVATLTLAKTNVTVIVNGIEKCSNCFRRECVIRLHKPFLFLNTCTI